MKYIRDAYRFERDHVAWFAGGPSLVKRGCDV